MNDRTEALAALVRVNRYAILEKTGMFPQELLGCGNNGCVYSVRGSDTVLKVAYSSLESELAAALTGPRVKPFLPVFYGGWQIEGAELGVDFAFKIGFLQRENLADWTPDDPGIFSDAATDLLMLGRDTADALAESWR